MNQVAVFARENESLKTCAGGHQFLRNRISRLVTFPVLGGVSVNECKARNSFATREYVSITRQRIRPSYSNKSAVQLYGDVDGILKVM